MQASNDSGPPARYTEIGLHDYYEVIVKYHKLIGYIVGFTFILSIIVSLLLPKMYIATARIIPPRENSPGLASLLSKTDDLLGGLAASLMGNQTPAELYVGIMKSRSMADVLNQKFKLRELYGLKYIEDVYSKLEDRSNIEVSKRDQLISVSVKDRDPQRAADIANAYLKILEQIDRRLNIAQGKRRRVFLENRLKEVRADLEKAELNLKVFQEKYRLVAIQEQAKVAIEGAAEIKGEIIVAQTELEVLKQIGTEKQIEAVMLKARIEELEKQLKFITHGQITENLNSNPSETNKELRLFVPFDDLPRLEMQLMRLTREAKIQEKLFGLLSVQYEMARIEESRDVDTLQILDWAVPAEKKSSPKRFAIILASVGIATLVSIFIAFLVEYTDFSPSVEVIGIGIVNRIRQHIPWTKSRK